MSEPFDKDERDGAMRMFALLTGVALTGNADYVKASRELAKHLVETHGMTDTKAKREVVEIHCDAMQYVISALLTEGEGPVDPKKAN